MLSVLHGPQELQSERKSKAEERAVFFSCVAGSSVPCLPHGSKQCSPTRFMIGVFVMFS